MTGHAYIIEYVQAGTALIGIGFSLWATSDAVKDRSAIERAKVNGGKSLIARGHIRSEVKNVLVFTLYLIAGVTGILLPPPFTHEQMLAIRSALTRLAEFQELSMAIQAERDTAFASLIVRSVLTGATIIKVIDTLWERRDRRKYMAYLRAGLSQPHRRRADDPTVVDKKHPDPL